MPKIEMGKKYRLLRGDEARILCTDAPGEKPIIGYWPERARDEVHLGRWKPNGQYYFDIPSEYDLIEVQSAEDVIYAALQQVAGGGRVAAGLVVHALHEADMLKEGV